MKNSDAAATSSMLKNLPSIDELLRSETAQRLLPSAGAKYLSDLARSVTEELRSELRNGSDGPLHAEAASKSSLLSDAERRLEKAFLADAMTGIRRVINTTGVVIHTNLGRAPLSENAKKTLVEAAAGYCSVEFDIATGKRGKRGARAESLLEQLTGAESALIVNNCAAAAFLVLTVLASGGEVVISRGELVEIGGDFRIPDVLEQSGASLREVGTTNRTKLADYERAIGFGTRMILKVHPSNYRIVGFSAAPELTELAVLAREHGVVLYEDAGSGALIDLSEFGLKDEPVIAESIAAGVDIVTFSGDKLLGGTQAGIIVGRKELIEQIRKHPLYRALRVDKLIYAALEATLESYRREQAVEEIPVLRMLSLTKAQLDDRTDRFAETLRKSLNKKDALSIESMDGHSVVGGGSGPAVQPATRLLALTHSAMSAERLEYGLRNSDPPVIARIADGRVVIDLRTVSEAEEAELLGILAAI